MSVKIKDKGTDKLLKLLSKRTNVKVGIIGSEASEKKSKSKETNVEVAAKHEFGIGVPKRSFLRDWHDENLEKLKTMLVKTTKKAIETGDTENPFNIFGLVLVGEIQDRISKGISPGLAQSTIDRKGSSVPLIDTGQLRSSITHVVKEG